MYWLVHRSDIFSLFRHKYYLIMRLSVECIFFENVWSLVTSHHVHMENKSQGFIFVQCLKPQFCSIFRVLVGSQYIQRFIQFAGITDDISSKKYDIFSRIQHVGKRAPRHSDYHDISIPNHATDRLLANVPEICKTAN